MQQYKMRIKMDKSPARPAKLSSKSAVTFLPNIKRPMTPVEISEKLKMTLYQKLAQAKRTLVLLSNSMKAGKTIN